MSKLLSSPCLIYYPKHNKLRHSIVANRRSRGLIQKHADISAAKPEMWGGQTPTDEQIKQLAACFAWAWDGAVDQMLGHWPTPPTTTGY
jgi:hypothetical protein